MSEFDYKESQQKRYQDLITETTKQIQSEQEKIANLDETKNHLEGMKSELIRKQEIISKTATHLRETISLLKDELDKLNVEGDLNPLSKLKEDILTETLIYESKKREIEAYEP